MKSNQDYKKNLIVLGNHNSDASRLGELISKELPGYQIVFFDDAEHSLFPQDLSYIELIEFIKNSKQSFADSEKYHFLFENTANAIFLVDVKSGFYIDANNAALKLTGRSLKEIKSLKTADLSPRGADRGLLSLNSGDEIRDELVEYKRPDGSVRIAKLNVLHFRADLYFGIAQDVTSLIEVQTDFCERSRMYKSLVNNLTGFVYQCKNDQDRTMIFMSSNCEKVTGYQSEEFIDNKSLSYNDLILKEYQDTVREQIQHAIVSRQQFEIRYPIKHKNKQIRWLKERAIGVYGKHGELLHIEGFVTDETESYRYELVQKALFKISSFVIDSEDMETFLSKIKIELATIIDTTNFYVALYNAEKDTFSLPYFTDQKDSMTDLPAGKTLTKYVVETRKSLLANIEIKNQLVQQGKLEFKGSLSKVWLGVPLKVDGKITGVLAVQSYDDENAYNDSDMKLLEFVSDQIGLSIHIKQKEDALKDALQKAEEADRLKTAFLANMIHEIRTPMNGILGFTQLLKEEDISHDESQKFLGIIEKSGNRMLNIINDLIDVSKVDAGLMDVNISGVDLYEFTHYIYTFFVREVEQKGMQLNLIHPNNPGSLIIQTDGEKLYAILTNLIKNAIKYSEKGSIRFGYFENTDGDMEFFVKDAGIGIPEEMKKDVFSRFVQLNSTTDPFTEGSGLGLSITKAYVELLGGKIWFDSTKNKGTEFYFIIPNLD